MSHVLFVDDNERVLKGISRMLRRQSKRWNMEFALGGREALTKLAAQRYDVVISDIRMPDVDGIALFAEVRKIQPHAIRIALSGYRTPDDVRNVLVVAHEFLAKPCSRRTLRTVIARALGTQAAVNNERLRAAVMGVGGLPTPPSLLRELTDVTNRSTFGVNEIAAVVRRDPGVSAKILQVANSAAFGTRRKATTIQTAISIMGTDTVRDLSIGLSALSAAGGDKFIRIRGFSVDKEQQHAISVAQVARSLMGDSKNAEEAFLGGLLHDIGKLVMASRFTDAYRAARESVQNEACSLAEAEREHVGFTHAEAGAALMHAWGLPTPLQAIAAEHHGAPPGVADGFDSAMAVRVANTLAAAQISPLSEDEATVLADEAVAARLQTCADLPLVRGWLDRASSD